VTLTATVPKTGAAVPTGTLTFSYNGSPIGTGTLNSNGVATLTTSTLPVGTGTITVSYSGDSNYTSATSVPVPITVVAAQAMDFTLSLTSAQNQTAIPGQAVSYAVRVAPTSSAYPGGSPLRQQDSLRVQPRPSVLRQWRLMLARHQSISAFRYPQSLPQTSLRGMPHPLLWGCFCCPSQLPDGCVEERL
jgi:hypothetical protein